MGFPAWERRNDVADDGASATPPPILRNRGPAAVVDAIYSGEVQGTRVGVSSRPTRVSTFGEFKSGLGSGLSNVMASQDGGVPLTFHAAGTADLDSEAVQPSHVHGRRWFNLGRVTQHKTVGT